MKSKLFHLIEKIGVEGKENKVDFKPLIKTITVIVFHLS